MAETRWWTRLKPTRRRVVTYIVVLLALLAVRLGLGLWAGYQLRSVSEPLAAKYGGLDLASLAPAPVAPFENRARILSAAAALTVVHQDAHKESEVVRALSTTGSTDSATRVAIARQAVAENELALSVLDRAETRAGANWEVRYRDGLSARLPPYVEIRALANASGAAALVALADGQPDEAARHARLGLVLSDSLAREPLLNIQVLRPAMERTAIRRVRELLGAGEPSAPALDALADRLDSVDGDAAVIGLIGELKYVSALVERLTGGDVTGFWKGDASWPTRSVAGAVLWIGRPLLVAARTEAIRQLDTVIEYARLRPFERAARHLPPPSSVRHPWWLRPFTPLQAPTAFMDPVVRAGDEQRAIRMLARTAVALRRHRLAHGAYPATLAELDPSLLANAPIDPYTGRAVDYAREDAGFTLRVAPPSSASHSAETRDLFVWKVPR